MHYPRTLNSICFYGCSNWMIPNLYSLEMIASPHIHLKLVFLSSRCIYINFLHNVVSCLPFNHPLSFLMVKSILNQYSDTNYLQVIHYIPLSHLFSPHKILWWKKSCTTWDLSNLVNNGIKYLSIGAGFFPSTVARRCKHIPSPKRHTPLPLFKQETFKVFFKNQEQECIDFFKKVPWLISSTLAPETNIFAPESGRWFFAFGRLCLFSGANC